MLSLAGGFAAVGSDAPVADRGALTDDEFVHLHESLAPAREAWRELPWESSLLEARERAVREGKPIYLLVRSGHPLGAV